MIVIQKLRKTYPGNIHPVLKDISLTFPDTGLFYLVGKSGAGKSTLLQLIGLMDSDYEGSLKVNGKELKNLSEQEKADYRFSTCSFVFQSFKAEDEENVETNLLKALAITNLSEEEKKEKIRKNLQRVGLEGKQKETFKHLSGGEKKRISLVRALIKETPILLCDEPIASLNPGLRRNITDILAEESKKRLVIIITHEREEIPSFAIVYSLENGNIKKEKEGLTKTTKPASFPYYRRKFKGKPFFFQLFHTFFAKKEFLFITLFTLAIGLFSISFSFQLSLGVSQSLVSSMSAFMEDDSFVVEKEDNSLVDTSLKSSNYQKRAYLLNRYPEDVLALSSFYLTSLDDIFLTNQEISFQCENRSFSYPQLSLNSFLDYQMPEEIKDIQIYGEKDIQMEEVILGLDEVSLQSLYSLYFQKYKEALLEEDLVQLGQSLKTSTISVRIQANVSSWSYHQDYSYALKGFVLTKKPVVIHPSYDFNSYFVNQVMHFKEVLEEEEIPKDVPWTLKKAEGLRLYPHKVASFLRHFLQDENLDDYVPKVLENSSHYQKNDPLTHNHIALYQDYLPKVSLSQMNRFIQDNPGKISSVSYSSPVYTYTASGYISGFQKPFFFARRKEKLNAIQDSYLYSEENLGSFQGSLIDPGEDVIKGDLLSAMEEDGLRFLSLQGTKPKYGKVPARESEIGISTEMAKKLFGKAQRALEEPLYTLTLDETRNTEQGYKNLFSEGELTIVGIYEKDSLAIYQDSLFPLCYAFAHSSLKPEEIRIEQAVFKCDIQNHSPESYLNAIRKYGSYSGSFPMLEMVKEIKKTLKQLSTLFLSLSGLSLLSAVFLLSISLYLILEKDRKEIGILLSLGYTKKEIEDFYLSFSVFLGFLSFLLSFVITVMAERILKQTLEDLLSHYTLSLFPYVLSWFVALFLTTVIGLLLSRRVASLTPMEAFRKEL